MKRLSQNRKKYFNNKVLFVALGFLLFSSPRILTPIKLTTITPAIDKALESKIASGSFFIIPSKESEGYSIKIGNETLSYSKNHKHLIGAIALNPHDWTSLWGWRKTASGESPYVFEWFQKWIAVEKPALSMANRLRLPAAVIQQLDSADDTKKSHERIRMKEAIQGDSESLITNCFQLPIKSKVVSKFASPRQLPSGVSYHHTGVDLRAATGTPIKTAGQGKVVLAEKMIVPGNTVIVDHGGGLYTSYKHLSRIDVSNGEVVPMGKVIGLAGATGRVEASHLHWDAYWKGNPANPLQLLQASEPICDQL